MIALHAAFAAVVSPGPLRRLLATSPRPRKHLQSLVPALYAELNQVAFHSALPEDLPVTWNARLRRTAGRCIFVTESPRGAQRVRLAAIELSPRVLDDADRLRTTLAHEMCHAAHWLVDGVAKPPHGEAFRKWARLVEERVPNMIITTRHSYEVACQYTYECTHCGQQYGRHSRLDLERRRCGRCAGTLQLLGEGRGSHALPPPGAPARMVIGSSANGVANIEPRTTAATKGPRRTVQPPSPAAPLEPVLPLPAFAAFVQAEYAILRRQWPRVTHQRIMQTLANKWRRLPKQAKAGLQAQSGEATSAGSWQQQQRQTQRPRRRAAARAVGSGEG